MELKVLVVTFNCASHKHKLFPLPHDLQKAPDVIAFALQEVGHIGETFLGANSLLAVESTVDSYGKAYGVLYRNQIVSQAGTTALSVHVNDNLPYLLVDTADVGTGVLGMIGNKGAAAVRLEIPIPINNGTETETRLVTFVCAHLAAHGNMAERRNQDFKTICENLVFSDHTGIYSSDHLLFAGDLNYRTSDENEPSLGDESTSSWTVDKFMSLLPKDQLMIELKSGRTLAGLVEADISFPPTFKMAKDGSGSYDTKRWPSWCDRILHLPVGISVARYTSLPPVKHSDHLPVCLEAVLDLAQSGKLETAPHKTNDGARNQRDVIRQVEAVIGAGVMGAPLMAAIAAAYALQKFIF